MLDSLSSSIELERNSENISASFCLCVCVCVQELGVTDNPNYKITFMLDSAAMITVHTPKRGVVEVGVGCCCRILINLKNKDL